MTETDVIGHLLNIEQQAADLLLDAQTEADRRIAEARNTAENQYKTQYEKLIQDFESKYSSEVKAVDTIHDSTMSNYKDTINHNETDTTAFDALMNELLFNSLEKTSKTNTARQF